MTRIVFLMEPTVHLLAAPVFYPHPEYKLPVTRTVVDTIGGNETRTVLQGTDCERIVAHAGKGCYDSYGEDGRPIATHIDSLISSYHGSVLEHANVTLFITGISRGLSHELVRHRAGFAYSQRSTRYVNESSACFVLDPYYADIRKRIVLGESVPKNELALYNDFEMACYVAMNNYVTAVQGLMEQLRKEGRDDSQVQALKWARGKARQLLPHALETRMTITANLRAWRMFLEVRSAVGAEAEIRRLTNYIFPVLHKLAPSVFADYSAEMKDGFLAYTPLYRKV